MAHVVSTMIHIIERYLNEQPQQNHVDADDIRPQIESFLDKARSFRDSLIHPEFLLTIVECHMRGVPKADPLMNAIINSVHFAEDSIESHIVGRSIDYGYAADGEVSIHDQRLPLVVKTFEAIRLVRQHNLIDAASQRKYMWPVDNSLIQECCLSSNKKNKKRKANDLVAIYEDDFQTLKSRLLEQSQNRTTSRQVQIIPIIGQMGMGKRTLAFRLYNDSDTVNHFPTRACVNAIGETDLKVILLELLESLGGPITRELRRQTADQLGKHLHNTLTYTTKYLILIHNLHDRGGWITLKSFFPEDRLGSRILFTAVIEDDGTTLDHGEVPHLMRSLTDDESWLLFCHKVFALDHCPDHDLEPIGKAILGYCKGLTQLVVCVAGLLATSDKTPTFWELVAATLSSTLEGESDTHIILFKVVVLLYNHLPYYLKPCLLYIGAFRDCCDIQASNIIKLWIAEGFVKQTADYHTMEIICEAYLEVLIDKNLLHLTRQDPSGRIKSFHIHPALRISYMMIASVEDFVSTKDILPIYELEEDKGFRRVSGSKLLQPGNEVELSPLARSFISTGLASTQPNPVFVRLIMLRVLDVFPLELFQFPQHILSMILLRYLAFSCHSNVDKSIFNLWNLQALIIRRLPSFRAFSLPIELLRMEQLIHLKCKTTFLWRCPKSEKKFLNGKLQTLSNLQLFGVTTEFFQQVPNIRKLGIFCNFAMRDVLDLACLNKLEKLKCSSDWSLASKNFLSYVKFPSSLGKLTLNKCRIPWGFMKVVGALSCLEELKLQNGDFLVMESGPAEPEWEPAEGEFPRLISLVMKDLNLVHWKAHANHFPKLKQLVILNCYAMIGIPVDIGDIQTLELIHVNKHSPSVVASVTQIKEKHEACGNTFLEVQITESRGYAKAL